MQKISHYTELCVSKNKKPSTLLIILIYTYTVQIIYNVTILFKVGMSHIVIYK